MNHQVQTSVIVLLSLLKQSKCIDRFSLVVTLMAFVLLICGLFIVNLWLTLVCFGILILALWQKYYAIRVGIDIDLFKYFIDNKQDIVNELQSIDQALIDLNLKTSNNASNRSLQQRQLSTLKLLKKQGAYCLIQWLLLLTSIILFMIKQFN